MKNNNKIAIVSASLGVGGAERFAGLLSIMLQDLGYEVHNIIILDHVDYDFKGKLINLGKLFANEKGVFRAIKKGKYIAKYLFENDIQVVIDNRSRPTIIRELLTKWIYGNRKTYFMIHISKLEVYLPKPIFLAKFLYSNSNKLICVSKEIEQKAVGIYGFKNIKTIYNPVIFPMNILDKPISLPEKYILFFGRLEDKQKNLNLLLDSYYMSKVYDKGYHLILVGDGPSESFIEKRIKQLELEDFVKILPFNKNILPFIQHSKFSILTSRNEGFPMSIVESLAAGIPVVSVDCETGPKEIIQNNYNGLLVPNYDENALANAISDMISDKELYETCKNNAQKSVEHLSLTAIAQQWKQLLES